MLGKSPVGFVTAHTELRSPPLVPELALHLAREADALWQRSEEQLAELGLPAPFWAFAWAGGQALARYVLDNPGEVAGQRVLDFAAGSGLVGLAAARVGAGQVLCADIDPIALTAIRCNAAANELAVEVTTDDLVGRDDTRFHLYLVGDGCYEEPLATEVMDWLRTRAGQGATVLIGDPGRATLPRAGLERIARYRLREHGPLEDFAVRNTSVWRIVVS